MSILSDELARDARKHRVRVNSGEQHTAQGRDDRTIYSSHRLPPQVDSDGTARKQHALFANMVNCEWIRDA